MSVPPSRRVTTYEDREEWITFVLASRKHTPGAKLTGVALGQHLNFKSGRLDPSALRLAQLTAQTPGAIAKHLRALKQAGLIEWQSAKGRVSNKYWLTFPTLSEGTVIADANPVPSDNVGGNATLSSSTGLEANPIQSARPTLSERTAQPYPGVDTNLVLNRELNLCADSRLARLRRRIGEREWASCMQGMVFEPGPPPKLIFQYLFQRNNLQSRHGMVIDELLGGIELCVRDVA